MNEIVNIIVTILFHFELSLLLTILGFKDYFKNSKMNLFNYFIVMISTVDVFVSNIFLNDEMRVNSTAITVIKAFRIIRLFKLARYWENFKLLFETLELTLMSIFPLA